MTGSAGGSRSDFDWRSALLLALLAGSFLAGRISVSHEMERLRAEIHRVTIRLHAAQEQYTMAAGIPDMPGMDTHDPALYGMGGAGASHMAGESADSHVE